MAGLLLDDWQEYVLGHILGERADRKWACPQVALVVPRQNGKNAIQEARELAGLFLLPERLLIHSAHQFDTSVEQFRRLWRLIESTPDLEQCVQKVSKAHGSEGIIVKVDGREKRIDFRTRTGGGGRGFTCDCLTLDEAMILPEPVLAALEPALSAVPNPQTLYCGSAVDEKIHEHGVAFSRIRARGIRGNDPELAFFEWSANVENADALTDEQAEDRALWREANPGLGIRISDEHIAREQRAMAPDTFASERLGVGRWPDPDGMAGRPISPQMWAACADPESKAVPVGFAFDIAPDRGKACIAAAGKRADGLWHVGVIKHKAGTGWIAEALEILTARDRGVAVVCDAAGPAASLLPELAQLGVEVTPASAADHAAACGLIFDLVEQDLLRHCDTPELRYAIGGAVKRPLGDRWAWSRKDASVDISPIVATTLAAWAVQTLEKPATAGVVDVAAVWQEMQEREET